MFADYFSPLAPVVILLLSAFVLSIITPRLPDSWQAHWLVRFVLAPGLVIVAGLVLLGTESSQLQLLSGWHFGTAESGAGLTLGINSTNFPFFLLTIVVLLVTMLISLPLDNTPGRGWSLMLGSTTILLFAAANRLTLTYTVLLVDILLAYHWLVHKQTNLAVTRLFLGFITTGAIMLNAGLAGSENFAGTIFLESTLWLRLGLYPFFELQMVQKQSQNHNFLAYWSFSLAAGIYLVTQTLTTPLPEILRWLVVVTMLVNGLLCWLLPANKEEHVTLLTRLVFTQALLPLFLVPSSIEILSAFALGLALSLAVLWATSQLGRGSFDKLSRFWPYAGGMAATVTLIGVPFGLTWPTWTTFYPADFSADAVETIMVMLAVTWAMSSLTRYWFNLWRGESSACQQPNLIPAITATIAAVPFLVPGLGLFILQSIMQVDFPMPGSGEIASTLLFLTLTTLGAIGLGYSRTRLITRFNLPDATLTNTLELNWLLTWTEKLLSRAGKFILRVSVILEGQHYIGWALFTALVGSLIIILMRA
jgi:hypothetical protein